MLAVKGVGRTLQRRGAPRRARGAGGAAAATAPAKGEEGGRRGRRSEEEPGGAGTAAAAPGARRGPAPAARGCCGLREGEREREREKRERPEGGRKTADRYGAGGGGGAAEAPDLAKKQAGAQACRTFYRQKMAPDFSPAETAGSRPRPPRSPRRRPGR